MIRSSPVNQGQQLSYNSARDAALTVQRNNALGVFILDQLVAAGKEMSDTYLHDLEERYKSVRDSRKDRNLMRPFHEAEKLAGETDEARKDLKLITAHVDDVYDKYIHKLSREKETTPSLISMLKNFQLVSLVLGTPASSKPRTHTPSTRRTLPLQLPSTISAPSRPQH
jgi:hypothetical protein